MRPIRDFNNGLGPRQEEFNDTIIRITNAYLALREKSDRLTENLLIMSAAASLGWGINPHSSAAELIEDIAKKSQYQNPIIRERDWDGRLVAQAFDERLKGLR